MVKNETFLTHSILLIEPLEIRYFTKKKVVVELQTQIFDLNNFPKKLYNFEGKPSFRKKIHKKLKNV